MPTYKCPLHLNKTYVHTTSHQLPPCQSQGSLQMNTKNRANFHKIKHILPIVGSLIVLAHCTFTMVQGKLSLLTLSVFMYADLILVQYCKYVYQRLPPHEKSLRKSLVKFALWLLFTGIFFAIVCQSAPYYGPLTAGLFYAMAIGSSVFLFYAYMIYDGDENCCDKEEKHVFSVVEWNSISEKV